MVSSRVGVITALYLLALPWRAVANPPSPQEVANTVKEKWLANQFEDLEAYVKGLYTGYPDYIPAILTAAFRDMAYGNGGYDEPLGKYVRVRQWVAQNGAGTTDAFVSQLLALQGMILDERRMIREHGLSESQFRGNPSALRELWDGMVPFFPITILFEAPAATITGPEDAHPLRVNLRMTEIMYHPEEDSMYAYIELQNIGPQQLDLSGLSFSSPGSITFDFAGGSIKALDPGGYLLVVADTAKFTSRYGVVEATRVAGEYKGHLTEGAGKIVLKDGHEQVIMDFTYDPAWYPSTDGGGHSLVLVNPIRTSLKSMGRPDTWRPSQDKGGSPGNYDLYFHPARLNLRITEIMYHPGEPPSSSPYSDREDYEFIELQNIGTESLSLTDLSFVEGVTFSFDGSRIRSLGTGDYVLVVKNEAAFKSRYTDTTVHSRIAGQYGGDLSNAGERVLLKSTRDDVITDFTYDPNWYESTDGRGHSLVLVYVKGTSLRALSKKDAWRASWQVGGSPAIVEQQPPVQAILKEVIVQSEKDVIVLISFPRGIFPTDVDPFTKIMLDPGGIEARDQGPGSQLAVFFDLAKVREAIKDAPSGAMITLRVSGKLLNGNSFTASTQVAREKFGE